MYSLWKFPSVEAANFFGKLSRFAGVRARRRNPERSEGSEDPLTFNLYRPEMLSHMPFSRAVIMGCSKRRLTMCEECCYI